MKAAKIITVLLIALVQTSVFAASQAGSAFISLNGGYEFFASKRNIQNTGVPYLLLGYQFTDHWGIEGLFGAFTTHSSNTNDKRRVNGMLASVDGTYRFTYRCLEPFLLAGVGATGLNPNGNSANYEGNINAGAGAQWFLNEVIAFRAEARDFYTIVGGKNDVLLGAGISFYFNR